MPWLLGLDGNGLNDDKAERLDQVLRKERINLRQLTERWLDIHDLQEKRDVLLAEIEEHKAVLEALEARERAILHSLEEKKRKGPPFARKSAD